MIVVFSVRKSSAFYGLQTGNVFWEVNQTWIWRHSDHWFVYWTTELFYPHIRAYKCHILRAKYHCIFRSWCCKRWYTVPEWSCCGISASL